MKFYSRSLKSLDRFAKPWDSQFLKKESKSSCVIGKSSTSSDSQSAESWMISSVAAFTDDNGNTNMTLWRAVRAHKVMDKSAAEVTRELAVGSESE